MTEPQTAHADLLPTAAGRMMTSSIPIISASATIRDAETLLIEQAKRLDAINYVYLTDHEKHLLGVLSVREIFALPKTALAKDAAVKELITARVHTLRDRVAFLAIEHNLKEIPVVDADNRLLGVVPYDAILKTLREEHIEDALRSAGVHSFDGGSNLIHASALTLIKKRVPWLIMGMLGSAVAAAIITLFQTALETQLLLAAFIPAITYIAGAVGIQSETILIRTASVDKNFSFIAYVKREIITGIGLSILLGAMIGIISYLIWQTAIVSIILGTAFLVAVLGSMAIAVLLPWVLSKFKLDPAITGGPLDTILSDILSISVYFIIANAILSAFAS